MEAVDTLKKKTIKTRKGTPPKTRLKIPDFASLGKPTKVKGESKERKLACETSHEVIRLLLDKDMNQKQIAELMGKSVSFVSRVYNKKRNLSIEDLEQLEKATKLPIPLLLSGRLKNKKNVPAHMKKFYAAAEKALKASVI